MAVVLPTGGLLWFMSRVIANERLVVQQKLATLYQDKLSDALAKTESLYKARVESLDKLKATANPYALFRRVVLESEFQGLVVWGPDGSVVFPQSSSVLGPDVLADSPLAAAWREEFANHQYGAAVEMYERFVTSPDPLLAVPALMGKSRCLARLRTGGRSDCAMPKGGAGRFAGHGEPVLARGGGKCPVVAAVTRSAIQAAAAPRGRVSSNHRRL